MVVGSNWNGLSLRQKESTIVFNHKLVRLLYTVWANPKGK